MSSAICFSLDQSKISSSGNGLSAVDMKGGKWQIVSNKERLKKDRKKGISFMSYVASQYIPAKKNENAKHIFYLKNSSYFIYVHLPFRHYAD